MAYKVETFGSWEGTLKVDEHFRESDGRSNFTINTVNPPQVVAEVRRVGEVPFRLAINQEAPNPPVREV